MSALLNIILIVLDIYVYVVLAAWLLSWLISSKTVDGDQPWANLAHKVLLRLTDPVLGPIRRYLPDLGGIDISPLVVIVLIILFQRIVVSFIYPLVS